MQKTITSVEEMMQFGHYLSYIHKYHKILLHGDLGAGKTHLVKGWVKGIYDQKAKSGNSSDIYNSYNINSPTYTYYQTYGDILHMDMYRLAEYSDLIGKGILDQILDHEYIAVERPRHETAYIDKSRKNIYISKIDENTRSIEIQ